MGELQPLHVLYVDRSVERGREWLAFCQGRGWESIALPSIEEALNLLSGDRCDYEVALVDIKLIRERGPDALREFSERFPHVAVVAMTEEPSKARSLDFIRAGAIDVLPLPVEYNEIEEVLRNAMARFSHGIPAGEIYEHLNSERSCFEFLSSDICGKSLSLPILGRLERSGVLGHGVRLRLELAFQEALANSIEHGNLGLRSGLKDEFDAVGRDSYSVVKECRLKDPAYGNRRVTVISDFDGGTLTVVIQDEGDGFNWREVVPAYDATTLGFHGRGFEMIRAAVDELSFNDKGTEITLKKKVR